MEFDCGIPCSSTVRVEMPLGLRGFSSPTTLVANEKKEID